MYHLHTAKNTHVSFQTLSTIAGNNLTYVTFIPDELFWVIACVCVRKRILEESIWNYLAKITLPKSAVNYK